MKDEELKEMTEKNNILFLAKFEISKEVIDSLFKNNNKKDMLRYNLEKEIKQRIDIFPMYGNSLTPDLTYQYIIGLKNDNPLKAKWNDHNIHGSKIEFEIDKLWWKKKKELLKK